MARRTLPKDLRAQVIAGLRNASLRKLAAEAVRFSIQEDQIVRPLLRGKSNKEIAISLKISEKTVKNYMTILMQKLNARNRLVIAAQALTEGEHDDSSKLHPAAASPLLSLTPTWGRFASAN
jgi:DNA-binding NarL/FixJ family response regulator